MEENELRKIEELIESIKKKEVQPTAQELMEQVGKPRYYVPVQVTDPSVLKDLDSQIKATGKAKLPANAGAKFVIINNNNKEQFVGIYTSSSQIPANMKNNCVIQMPFSDIMKFAADPAHKCSGIVINPFTQNFMLRVQTNGGPQGAPQQLTPDQIHELARRNVEFVLLPHGVYKEGKDYFDNISADFIYGLYMGQYNGNIPCPIKRAAIEVMNLGISDTLDLIDVVLPKAPGSRSCAHHILITWDSEKNRAGYYAISDKFLFIDENGKVTEIEEMPAEGSEMTAVLEREEKR